jgi:hypothetical protein
MIAVFVLMGLNKNGRVCYLTAHAHLATCVPHMNAFYEKNVDVIDS